MPRAGARGECVCFKLCVFVSCTSSCHHTPLPTPSCLLQILRLSKTPRLLAGRPITGRRLAAYLQAWVTAVNSAVLFPTLSVSTCPPLLPAACRKVLFFHVLEGGASDARCSHHAATMVTCCTNPPHASHHRPPLTPRSTRACAPLVCDPVLGTGRLYVLH